MIDVAVNRNKDGDYTAFICSGHAGFAEYGNDIVCSAVSLLVINTINSLDEITHEPMDVNGDEKKGLITCKFRNRLQDSSRVLVDSMILGLQSIEKQYGEKYCRIRIKEV
jgi:uncharacterized protein YsxB (DUF464 family)